MEEKNRVTEHIHILIAPGSGLISESTGGAANFRLIAGPSRAHKDYLILAGVSIMHNGIPLPGWAVMPFDWDPFTTLAIGLVNTPSFSNFMGQLDAAGESIASFDTLGPLPPGSADISIYFAYTVRGWQFVSNATMVSIVP